MKGEGKEEKRKVKGEGKVREGRRAGEEKE